MSRRQSPWRGGSWFLGPFRDEMERVKRFEAAEEDWHHIFSSLIIAFRIFLHIFYHRIYRMK